METTDHYATLLLVEDNANLAELMQHFLEDSGYHVTVIADGTVARDHIIEHQPDLTILDIMLPGMDGLAVCRQVRPHYKHPIIILTAKNDPIDEILGLELGADDYLTKPVEPKLLVSRVRAHLRRALEFNQALSGSPDREEPSPIDVDHRNRLAYCWDEPLDLTTPEFNLLALLHSKPGHIFTRDDIMKALRGIEYDGQSRAIDMLVSSLRSKLPFKEAIKTVRSKGYFLVEPHLLSACDK
ncbi:response regulator transcription factor [Saccharospirillum salsuginis]|uniref:DNA-binding response regulator n=1 Tax=Saccharospirillum salsuginis TaxID=418750 RepID=A0A918K5J6_9GAMM|nr:response regulator transcription factor [Saccharospirillum salsuginis]GGX50467.1 DNA-binding response regulator [Saccharospirillum salsuginis]